MKMCYVDVPLKSLDVTRYFKYKWKKYMLDFSIFLRSFYLRNEYVDNELNIKNRRDFNSSSMSITTSNSLEESVNFHMKCTFSGLKIFW